MYELINGWLPERTLELISVGLSRGFFERDSEQLYKDIRGKFS